MRRVLSLVCVLTVALSSEATAQSKAQRPAGPDSAILAIERRGWEAVKRKDTRAVFALSGGSLMYAQPSGMGRLSLATTPDVFSTCETRSYAIDSATVTPVGASGAVLMYRLTLDQTCGGQKLPTGFYSTVVYERRSGRWLIVARSDTPVEHPSTR